MTVVPGTTADRRARRSTAGWAAVLGLTGLVAVAWLVVGALVPLLPRGPGSEPAVQAVADHACSLAALVLAVALLRRAPRWWVARWLAVALVASSGAFTLQAHAAATVIREATGLDLAPVHQIVLHSVACLAFVLALLLYPTGRAELGGTAGRVAGGVGVALSLGVGLATALLPQTVSCVVLFGVVVPLLGLVALTRRRRHGLTTEQAPQVRLVVSVLVGALATTAVLALLTLVLLVRGRAGVDLTDPTAHTATGLEPTAPLFWSARIACVAIAVAVLMAADRSRLWSAERRFGQGLALGLLAVATGGTIALTEALLPATSPWVVLVVVVLVVAGLHPVLATRVDRWLDTLLHGRRPTPYSALAGLAGLTGGSGADGPDFGAVAESVGRSLGARWCRLAVVRPGLSERAYEWSADTGGTRDDGLSVAVLRDGERIGGLTVDRGVGAGVDAERRGLLDDVAEALAPVLESGRMGIELERQLRAATAHAEDIATSRRTVVAEMDHERRRIERDLHDGAQHHLVSLRLALGLVAHLAGAGQREKARERLGQALERIATAEAVLAETAGGVSSLVLAEHGVVSALQADLAGTDPPVTLTSELAAGRRFDEEIESAVYFCCLEAVNNARKHAGGAPVAVHLSEAGGVLRFRVRDEGPGFDVAAVTGGGRGLRNTTARITRLGGGLSFDSAPGRGTVVDGAVPVPPDPELDLDLDADGATPAAAAPDPEPVTTTELAATALAASVPDLMAETRTVRTSLDGTRTMRTALDESRTVRTSLDDSRPVRTSLSGPPAPGPSLLDAHTLTLAALDAGPAPAEPPAPPLGPGAARLVEQTRALLGEARDQSGDPALSTIAERLDGPLRVHAPDGVLDDLRGARVLVTDDAPDAVVAVESGGVVAAPPPGVGVDVGPPRLVVPEGGGPSTTELVERRLLRHAPVLRARSALGALDDVLRGLPGARVDPLRGRLEQLRRGAHVITEVALLAAPPRLPGADRVRLARLCGDEGDDPRTRLGLPAAADADAVTAAVDVEYRHWQQRATHPVSTRDVRLAAEAAMRTCDELLDRVRA